MNLRLPATAAIACILISLSLHSVVAGNGWLGAGIGAVLVVAAAGLLTRVTSVPAAVTVTLLTVAAVVPLLAGPTGAGRIGGLVIVVVVAAGAAGTRLLRPVSVVATYLSSLLIYVNLLFADQVSYGRVIPSPASATALGHLVSAAFAEFKYAPPIPDIRGVSLVTGAGIALVAVAVDLLAVRLRRPAAAGLPLLLLFSVPVASNLKAFGAIQIITFAAALAGYLALLSADGRERLRMWGRLVTFRHVQSPDEAGDGPDTRDLAASGRRIGFLAICLGVIVPLILPAVHARDVFSSSGHGSPSGTLVVQADPLANTQRALEGPATPVLTYTTTSADPLEQYLQQYVMNYHAGTDSWSTVTAGGLMAPQGDKLPWQVPGDPAASVTRRVQTTVRLGAVQSGQGDAVLPVPYAPVDLTVSRSSWEEAGDSLMIFSSSASPADLKYTVTSQEPDPTDAEISSLTPPGNISAEYGIYNGPDALQLQQIANRVTADASTPLQSALALQAWFTSGHFTYTLKPTHLPAKHWVLPFLTTDRRGLCTQFAQAFAVLARLVGIPSRVAVGYTAGTYSHGEWHVTEADAHAWPELYFAGIGWLRFEPTPGAAQGGQGTAYAPLYASDAPGSGTATSPGQVTPATPATAPASGATKLGNTRRLNKYGEPTGTTGAPGGHRTSGSGFAIAIPVVLVLLLAWPALTRLLTRRRRRRAAGPDAGLAHAAWRELTDDLTDFGLTGSPGETPRALTRRVGAGLDPAAVQALNRIGAAEERARYSRSPQPGGELAADVRTVHRGITAAATGRQRLRARFWPASTIQAAGRLTRRAGDALRWLEAPVPAMRRQLQTALHRSG